ncbi:MAG TPA: hypothetical protein PKG81_03400, partial [Candidatus Omnitrophota bacterium]|nr:hypothetical protein [Candidatus Omnitrophota bacterium]
PSAGWSVSINFMKDLSAFNGKKIRQKQINILLWMIAFILLLASILMGLYDVKRIKKPKLWAIAGAFSLLCITAACYTLHLSYAVPINEYQQDKIVVEDDISLNRFIGMSTKLSQSVCKKDPLFIPTGIHVQSMEFSTANNVSISGYIWQKYTKGIHDGISRGVIFPEAKTVSMNEMYRSDLDNGKVELIGWYFEATIRQDLDYSKFPFDQPNVSIWLRHKDFYNNIILIPDLKGYQFMNAIARPGIQGRLAMPGYALLGSFFSYTSKMMNANFGMDSFRKEARWPELFYNVLMKRNFITPLVSKFFPILIVISMLFIVLMSFSTDSAKQKNFGLTGFAVIGLVVSFFFSTLLTQIDLRQQFSADGIIFIENFNFLTYLMLLFSAVQAFVFSAEKKIWFIQYEHCLLPKLLYWPLFGFLVLCASLIYFY